MGKESFTIPYLLFSSMLSLFATPDMGPRAGLGTSLFFVVVFLIGRLQPQGLLNFMAWPQS